MPADDAVRAFDRGLAAASVAERLDATGLDMFDAQAHEKAIRRFTSASAGGARAPDGGAAGGGAGVAAVRRGVRARGQVGALQRELAKQRRGLGVRGAAGDTTAS